jgi:hypothetical protein
MQQITSRKNPSVVRPHVVPWYDDKAFITLDLGDLESFHRLVVERRIAYYRDKVRLNEFYVFGGRWRLDACGNTMRATEDPLPSDLRTLIPIATHDEFWGIYKIALLRGLVREESISHSMEDRIPPPGITCAHCKKPWSIANIYDAVVIHSTETTPLAAFVGVTLGEVKRASAKRTDAAYLMQSDILIRNDKHIDLTLKYPDTEKSWEKSVVVNEHGWLSEKDGVTDDRIIEDGDEGFFNCWKYFHIACRESEVTERTEKQFREILREAGYPSEIVLLPTPNEYGSASYRGPWFTFCYRGEEIRIGWRKRVIEIDWSRVSSPQVRALIALDFANVDSTHTDTVVHAYEPKVASSYLADIRAHLTAHCRWLTNLT